MARGTQTRVQEVLPHSPAVLLVVPVAVAVVVPRSLLEVASPFTVAVFELVP